MALLIATATFGTEALPAKKKVAAQKKTRKLASLDTATITAPRTDTVTRTVPPSASPPLPFILTGGLNFSYASGSTNTPGATRNGVSLSVSTEAPLGDNFFLCPELGYVQRGVEAQVFSFMGFNLRGDVKLDYLEVPLIVKKKFIMSKDFRLFVSLGPSVGVTLDREVELLGTVTIDESDRFRWYDATMMGGFGFEKGLTDGTSIIGTLRYTYGLIDIDKSTDSYKTRGIQLLIGVRFGN